MITSHFFLSYNLPFILSFDKIFTHDYECQFNTTEKVSNNPNSKYMELLRGENDKHEFVEKFVDSA